MNFCICKLRPGESPVVSRLAITPSQMLTMAENGIPIASQVLPDNHFEQGDTSDSFDIPLEFQRGIDMNSMWNQMKDIKARMRHAYKDSEFMRSQIKTE